jgi:DNA-binding MarR family transcriptional regulator
MADTSLIENNIGLLIWKASNFWQSKLRKILIHHKISLNEYLILKSIYFLSATNINIYQNEIANFIGIDVSVTSVTLKLLERKKYIKREFKNDNRRKNIKIIKEGSNLFNKIHPLLQEEEDRLFNKLNNETFNFTNSLKLILGRKLRIKAENKY